MTNSGNGKRTPSDVLRKAAQQKSARKRRHVIRTVDAMLARGDQITFASVERAANVSHWLVFQPELAAHIRAAMQAPAGPRWLAAWNDNDGPDEFYELAAPSDRV